MGDYKSGGYPNGKGSYTLPAYTKAGDSSSFAPRDTYEAVAWPSHGKAGVKSGAQVAKGGGQAFKGGKDGAHLGNASSHTFAETPKVSEVVVPGVTDRRFVGSVKS